MIITRDNYREYDALNYSTLSTLKKHPSLVEQDEEREFTDGMAFGSMVDTLLLEPEEFDDRFYINDGDREPSKTAKLLADCIFENGWYDTFESASGQKIVEYDLDPAKEQVGKSTDFARYGGEDYLESLILSKDKEIVSEELYEKAKRAGFTLSTHPFTRKYFTNLEGHQNLYQVPMVMEKDGQLLKSLVDIIHIDHKEKIVYPIDLKTMGRNLSRFSREYTRWGYYIQASLYTQQVGHWCLNRFPEYNDYPDIDFMGYTMDHDYPFKFVVVSQKSIERPLVFTVPYSHTKAGREGGVTKSGYELPGYEELIDRYNWHKENDKWNYDREVYLNNGELELEVFE